MGSVRFSPSKAALGYIALSLLALALFAIPLWYGFQANLGTFRSYVPGAEMQRLADILQRDGARAVTVAVESYLPSLPRDEVIVFADPDKRRLAGNLPAWPAEVPDVPGTYGLVIGLGGDATMRVVTSHVTLPGGYFLLMGRESVRFESLIERFWYGIAGSMAVVLALGAGLAWLLRRSLLSEVREISRSAAAIMDGDLSRRLPVRGGSSELDALAHTVNGMLAQLAVINASEDGFWDWSVAADEFYASPRLLEIYGFPPGTTFAGRADLLARFPFHPEDRPKWEGAVAEHFAGKSARLDIEMRVLPGGETRWIHLTGLATRTAAGEVTRWTGATRDITERKRAEALLDGEKRLLEHVARGSPLPAVLEEICRLFDELSSGLVSTIMLVEGERMRLGAAPNLPPGYTVRMADLPLSGPQSGLCALAVARRAPVIAPDLASDPGAENFRDLYLAHGLRALWSTPFMSEDGLPLGTFAIFSRQPGSPTAQQLGLIEQFTHIASIAVERKRNEDALLLSEERYALAMQASGEGHWDWKIGSDEYYTSPRHLEILGLPPGTTSKGRAEALSRIPYHPEDRAKYDAAVAEHFAGKTPRVDIQLRLLVRGELRWVHATGMCLRDAAHNPVRWAGSIADITEHKRAEEALRLSEERHARALAASNDGLWEWYPASDEMFVSPRARELFSIPDGARIRTRADVKAHGRFHPDDVPRIEAAVQASRAPESGGLDIEYRILGRPGGVRWIRSRGKVFLDTQGRPALLTGALTDITERKRAEQALLLSEERYARAMEGSDAGHWDWNIVTDEMFVSDRAREMLALPAGALPARRAEIMQLVPQHAEDQAAMADRVSAGIRSGVHERDYRIVPRPGELRWLRSRGKVYKDARGAAVRMTGSLTDITDRKLATDELRESEAALPRPDRAVVGLVLETGREPALQLHVGAGRRRSADIPAPATIGKTRWEVARPAGRIGLLGRAPGGAGGPPTVPRSRAYRRHRAGRVAGLSQHQRGADFRRARCVPGLPGRWPQHHRAQAHRRSAAAHPKSVMPGPWKPPERGPLGLEYRHRPSLHLAALKEIFGFAPERQFASRGEFFSSQPCHPDDLDRFKATVQAALAGDGPTTRSTTGSCRAKASCAGCTRGARSPAMPGAGRCAKVVRWPTSPRASLPPRRCAKAKRASAACLSSPPTGTGARTRTCASPTPSIRPQPPPTRRSG